MYYFKNKNTYTYKLLFIFFILSIILAMIKIRFISTSYAEEIVTNTVPENNSVPITHPTSTIELTLGEDKNKMN